MAHALASTLAEHGSLCNIVRVLELAPEGFLVTALNAPARPWLVRCALPPNLTVQRGDELVTLESAQGPVAIARVRAVHVQTQELPDGTRVHMDNERAHISVERADGTPLFRYDANSAHGTIVIENEALRVSACRGDLSFAAAGEIRLEASRVSLRATMPGADAQLSLSPRRARLEADDLQLRGNALAVDAGRTELRGEELHSEHKRAVIKLERLESVADVVVSTARNVYQSVHELLQQKAGSLRTLVSGTAQLQAREVAHRAADSYKIRSEKIHLG
ncbi:MAG: hypothetical protein JWN04_7 [Myxococcaceae bacterium]|nr:hypothetical protein [Myxococcaceae bacterium]